MTMYTIFYNIIRRREAAAAYLSSSRLCIRLSIPSPQRSCPLPFSVRIKALRMPTRSIASSSSLLSSHNGRRRIPSPELTSPADQEAADFLAHFAFQPTQFWSLLLASWDKRGYDMAEEMTCGSMKGKFEIGKGGIVFDAWILAWEVEKRGGYGEVDDVSDLTITDLSPPGYVRRVRFLLFCFVWLTRGFSDWLPWCHLLSMAVCRASSGWRWSSL